MRLIKLCRDCILNAKWTECALPNIHPHTDTVKVVIAASEGLSSTEMDSIHHFFKCLQQL